MALGPQEEQQHTKQWREVVERTWSDEEFKQRLLDDPKAVLAEAGIAVPPNLIMKVHEASPTMVHLILPAPPRSSTGGELTEAELEQVSGAGWDTSIQSLWDWLGCIIGVHC